MTEVSDGSDLCFPELLNTSCRKPTLSQSDVVFLHFLMLTISVFTVVLNLLVIISVSHFRRLHTPTNLLLLSLAVSDFTVGLVVLPCEFIRRTACWFLGEFMCSFSKYVNSVTVSSSLVNMVLISADRYVAICDPLHYPSRLTLTRVKMCIFLCWLCVAFYCSIYVKDDLLQKDTHTSCYGECVFVVDDITGIVDLVIPFITPVTIIIVLYMRVFVVALSQARAMRSHITAVSLQHSGTLTSRKSELKAARTLGILVVVFLTCFCPYYCVAFSGANSQEVIMIVLCLIYLNSCLNPVIYALFYPWFRNCVKLILTLQILQPGSREANIL
ncbi:trace amine-associated receptor 13c-like [Parambassis ranga]|uniref:Trace amine-associated receptor 13c-like n=1 Tax=Parambassis ranga TaxID=210632 RepID=A0A6P7H5H5_9TELE|nr:trace amine-associated receptor 13c-like [Parambassis ranga]